MAKTIEFYWDLGSTNSYFALHLIKPIAERRNTLLAQPRGNTHIASAAE